MSGLRRALHGARDHDVPALWSQLVEAEARFPQTLDEQLRMRSGVPIAQTRAEGPSAYQVPGMPGQVQEDVMAAKPKKRIGPVHRGPRKKKPSSSSQLSPEGNVLVYCRRRCGFVKRIQVPEGAAAGPFVAEHVGTKCPDCEAELHRRSVV
jgi:hypothetical protein